MMDSALAAPKSNDSNTRFRIVTGKGGVGKSVVACAIALAEAKKGKRVLLAEAQGRDQATSLLGAKPVGFEMREVLENLFIVDINPQDAIREYALLMVRFESIYKAVFRNRFVHHFLRMIPSLGEMVTLGKLWYHEQEQVSEHNRFDVIILDAPATGHALSMLRTPISVERVVPPGAMRENAKIIRELICDPERTCVHIVTLPEEMPVNEAKELHRVCTEEFNISCGTTFINQAVPKLDPQSIEVLDELGSANPTLTEAAKTLRLREQKRRAGEKHIEQLPEELLSKAVRLPRLQIDKRFGKAHLELLSAIIGESLDGKAHP